MNDFPNVLYLFIEVIKFQTMSIKVKLLSDVSSYLNFKCPQLRLRQYSEWAYYFKFTMSICESISNKYNKTKPSLYSICFQSLNFKLQPTSQIGASKNKQNMSIIPTLIVHCSSYQDSTAFLPYHRIDTPQMVKILLTIGKEPKQI